MKKKRRGAREEVGDGLAAAAAENSPGGPRNSVIKEDQQLYACFNSVIQGDHLGVEIATQAHRGLLVDNGLLGSEEEIRSTSAFQGTDVIQGLVIDDFFVASIEGTDPHGCFDPTNQTKAKEIRHCSANLRPCWILGLWI